MQPQLVPQHLALLHLAPRAAHERRLPGEAVSRPSRSGFPGSLLSSCGFDDFTHRIEKNEQPRNRQDLRLAAALL